MMPRLVIALAAIQLSVATAPLRCQTPATDKPDIDKPSVRELTQLVRSRATDDRERARALDALLESGIEGAEAAAKWASDEAKSIEHEFDKQRRRILNLFDRRAAKLVRERVRRHEPEIAELRHTVLTNARDPALSKETIEGSSDPAIAGLRSLLTVAAHEVIDADEQILASVIEVDTSLERLAEIALVWEHAIEVGTSGDGITKTIAALPPPTPVARLRDLWHDELEFHALLAMPMPSGDAQILRDNRDLAAELDPQERSGIRACNELRVLLGQNALRIDLKLCNAARDHSADMVRLDFFAHESPVPGKHRPSDRAAKAGTSGGAENIARGHDTGAGAITGWWYSPGHHRNMLGGHGRIGLGRAEDRWTQMFGG